MSAGFETSALDAQPVSYWLGPPAPAQAIFEHMRRWLHQPLPALGGLSPCAAVERAAPRREVHRMLRGMEHRGGPELSGVYAWVRAELGLADDGSFVRVRKRDRDMGRGRKASAALIDYAMPVLQTLTVDGPHEGEQVVRVAAEVWNYVGAHGEAVSAEHLRSRCVAALERAGLEVEVEELQLWIDILADRRPLFDDRRVLHVVEVGLEHGKFNVVAAGFHPSVARDLCPLPEAPAPVPVEPWTRAAEAEQAPAVTEFETSPPKPDESDQLELF